MSFYAHEQLSAAEKRRRTMRAIRFAREVAGIVMDRLALAQRYDACGRGDLAEGQRIVAEMDAASAMVTARAARGRA